MIRTLSLAAVLFSFAAAAQDDVASLYEISTAGSTESFKAGQKGKLVIEIRTKGGGHIKGETPMKIELAGKDVTPEKATLGYKDSVSAKKAGQQFPDPRFEVALSAGAPAKASVSATLNFFVCTDKLCAKQSKSVVVPVEVQ